MKLRSPLKINGRTYEAGDEIPWYFIYPFFLFHLFFFGLSGFFMAYARKPAIPFIYLHGGFAILCYSILYLSLFGADEVKWMFINAGLGAFGFYSRIDWLLSFYGKRASAYPWNIHAIPFLYLVLYTFLVRHALLDIFGAREDESKRKTVEFSYIILSIVVYGYFGFFRH